MKEDSWDIISTRARGALFTTKQIESSMQYHANALQNELSYLRNDLHRFRNSVGQLELREREVCYRLGVQPPIDPSKQRSEQLTREHRAYRAETTRAIDEMEKVLNDKTHQIKVLERRLMERNELIVKLGKELEGERDKDNEDEEEEEVLRPRRKSKRRAVSESPDPQSEDNSTYTAWTDLLRTVYPAFRATAGGAHSRFFKAFKNKRVKKDVGPTNALPDHLHETFLEEVKREFPDLAEFGRDLERDSDADPAGSANLAEYETPTLSKDFEIWKDIVRANFPYRNDAALEKKIRAGMIIFLNEHCASVNVDPKVCYPAGNVSRQYVIPVALVDMFIVWFGTEQKTAFKGFELKRKSSVEGPKKAKEEEEVHVIFDLSIQPIDEDLKLVNYGQFFPSMAHEERSKMDLEVRNWLLRRMRRNFPHCVITSGEGVTYGIPESLIPSAFTQYAQATQPLPANLTIVV